VFYDLGRSVAKIAENTPGGMLIFFPSYRVMEKCYEIWESQRVTQDIETKAAKKVFMEPKDPAKYQATMEKYYKTIFGGTGKGPQKGSGKQNGGAVLMGVCRGRISEGLDFSDNAARCVIVIGIPYPQMTDPKVILKKDYLDRKFRSGPKANSDL
jgi:Rad3-related DNA helicase